MWVYRNGEISHSSAASKGPIHAIQGLYVNWRELSFSMSECKDKVYPSKGGADAFLDLN